MPGRRRLREPSIRSRLTTQEGAVDQATSLLQQGPFDRATVHLLCRVLEEAWAQIATSYTGGASAIGLVLFVLDMRG